jgi:hypothetical protein
MTLSGNLYDMYFYYLVAAMIQHDTADSMKQTGN